MKIPRIPLSPTVRKLVAACALVAGVVVVGGELRGTAPRDVEVRLSLRAFADASLAVRSVDVTFLRGDTPMRAFRRNFGVEVPRELRETVTLPEGVLRARVTVVLDQRAVERESNVSVIAGESLDLPPPPP